jgi:hypothetical protein
MLFTAWLVGKGADDMWSTYSITACSQWWVLQAYKNDSYIKNIILTTPCIPIKNAARDTFDGDFGVPSGHTVLKEASLHFWRANRLFFESKLTFILEHSQNPLYLTFNI